MSVMGVGCGMLMKRDSRGNRDCYPPWSLSALSVLAVFFFFLNPPSSSLGPPC